MSKRRAAAKQPIPSTSSSPVWITAGIIALAFLLRIIWLGIKPPHFDEGVNGWFIDQMTRQGYYHYDPGNFHGPLHFYVLFLFQTLFGRDVWVLRLPIVLVSTASVALVFAFRRYFDRTVCTLAALTMAISPGMVFYGRYSIHETWLLFFLLLTVWGILGLWKEGTRRDLWAVATGVTGMILTKETYAIHVASLLLAFPALWVLESIFPSAPFPCARQHWSGRDLMKVSLLGVALIMFFYTGAFLDWPDFQKAPGTVGSLAGLWETFTKWAATGTGGQTGHEKPWGYWLELLARYEWPAAAGLAAAPFLLRKGSDRLMRYLMISGLGTLTAYSIIAYKTPWCLIVMMWPFLLIFGQALVRITKTNGPKVTISAGALLLSVSLILAVRLNYWKYTDESEPYVYVQTQPDVQKLKRMLDTLTKVSPAYYHIRGLILLPASETHPLPWLLSLYPRVQVLKEAQASAEMAADFLLIDDARVSDIEKHLYSAYFKEPFALRGTWQRSATLYLKASTFASILPKDRSPEFHPLTQSNISAPRSSDLNPELVSPDSAAAKASATP